MGRPAGWMTTLTGRPAMRSPGRPPIRRDVERAFWVKIAEGLTSEDAAVACGVSGPVGSRWFRERGGMPSIQLTAVSGRYLSFAEREEIALLKAQDLGVREIARRLGRSASTISRELRRNAATRSGCLDYRASIAQWKAELMARRPKTAKLATNGALRDYVQDRLAGTIRFTDGTPVQGPATVQWKGRNKARRQDRRWLTRGVLSRSPTVCRSISPMMNPCGSRTRPSTDRSTFRAVARCGENWSRACAPGVRCVFHVPVPGSVPAAMSRLR